MRIRTIENKPTIDFEYDYVHSSSTISYAIYDLIQLLNYNDKDGDEIQCLSIWINENVESNAKPSIYLDGELLSLGAANDIFQASILSTLTLNWQYTLQANFQLSIF